MKKVCSFILAISCSYVSLSAQQTDSLQQVKLNEIVVSSVRAKKNAPIAFSDLNQQQIRKDNGGSNIPFVLKTMPSVVSYSEGGTPIGNTSFRIRGTDANRINVTLNAMPLNNPESQEVYWVNLPDLSNSLKSIQVQRGVGTASNGAASFGANISLETTSSHSKAYGEASTAIGSYNAFISSIAVGTGVLKNGLSFDGRYSKVTGDGYIRNGKVDHYSAYAAISYYNHNQLLRAIYMNGVQHTGITWNGIDPETMKTNRKYNSAGEYTDDAGNVHYHDNETDNYYSNIVQFVYSNHLSNQLTLNASLNYNNGYGFYENYKQNQDLVKKFNISPQITANDSIHRFSDVVRRKMMSNNLYAANLNMVYTNDKFSITSGGMFSYYDGSHFGKLPWVKFNQNISPDFKWYRNTVLKRDINAFTKINYSPISRLNLLAELQYRYIDYRMRGFDDDMVNLSQKNYYSFFNPKLGVSYGLSQSSQIYFSYGISNREPLRADLKDSGKIKDGKKSKEIKSERLYDYELGYKYATKRLSSGLNLYYMDYKDQMVQTGKLSDVGYKLQENVANSYRIGVEAEVAYSAFPWLQIDGNVTLSQNKIKNYSAYFDNYIKKDGKDGYVKDGQIEIFKKKTDISFSPNLVGSGVVTIMPLEGLSFSLVNKYVGKMYYDNTSDKDNRLDDYFISDFIAGYTFDSHRIGMIDLQLFIYNVWNKEYVSNAYVESSFYDGKKSSYRGYYPQATCNIMARVGIRF